MRIACPMCKTVIADAPDDFPSRPFCSARCKLLDLGNWLDGVYRVSEPLDDTAEQVGEVDTQDSAAKSPEKPAGERSRGPQHN